MKSVLVFALLVACCAATVPYKGIDIPEDGLWDDIVAQINNVVKSVIDAVTGLWDKAKEQLGNIINNIKNVANGILQNIENVIGDEIEKLRQLIRDIVAGAGQTGAAIEQCAKNAQDAISALPGETINAITGCVNDEVQRAQDIYDETMAVIASIIEEVKSLPGKITSCHDIACLYKILDEAWKLLKNVPGQVTKIINDATDLLEKLPEDIINCETKNINDLLQKGAQIVADAEKCIAEAIIPQ